MPEKAKNTTSVAPTGLSCAGVGSADSGVPVKRGRGRLKGSPRVPGAGRKKGTVNRSTELGRAYIAKHSRDIKLLCDISAGKPVWVQDPSNPAKRVKVYPALNDRINAASKTVTLHVASIKAVELSGPDGGAVRVSLFDFLQGLPS